MKRSDERRTLSDGYGELALYEDWGIDWLPEELTGNWADDSTSREDIGESYPCGSESCFECGL